MSQKQILIVEDDPLLRGLYKNLLELNDYTVDTVGTIEEARAALMSATYSTVVLDMVLPNGRGTDLMSLLRDTRTVLVTGYGEELRLEERQLFSVVLQKPMLSHDLLLAIKGNSNEK